MRSMSCVDVHYVAGYSFYDEEYSVIYVGGLPYYLSWRFVGFILLD